MATNYDRQWNKMFSQLKKYKEDNGHCRVPYRDAQHPELGRWVCKQRWNEDKLVDKKRQKLDEIGFLWGQDIRKEKNKKWLTMFKKLERFQLEHGHCNVPSKFEPDRKLGRWVEVVRLNKEKLDDWKLEKLSRIGFAWSEDIKQKRTERWYEMYDKLQAFYETYGHSRVPEYWNEDKELSIWVICQRRPKKPISGEKRRLLDDLDFAWNNDEHSRQRDEHGRYITELAPALV